MVGKTSNSTSSLQFLILKIDLHNTKVWDGRTPVPSNSSNLPRSWNCSARSLQNWELMPETQAPESINAVVSCPSTITGISLECPTMQAIGSGLRKGTGATPGCPILCAAFIVVRFGSGSGRECWVPTVGCCGWCQWGLGHISSVSSQTGLKFWQGWHITKPCGPTLAPKALERVGVPPVGGAFLPIFRPLGVLVPSLYLLWSLCHGQQMCCGLRQSVPHQFSHYGSWGSQECSCPFIPSHCLSVWGYFGCWLGCCPVLP